MGVVRALLLGCAVLLLVGSCAGTSSEAPKEGQGHTEASKEQTRSSEAKEAEEEARCEGTRTFKKHGEVVATNDLPGCPKGGLLLGTDKPDYLEGGNGDDEIIGGNGADVIYGGDGSDFLGEMWDRGHDKLYCGEGKDVYDGDKKDFVSSSCEKKAKWGPGIP